MKIKISTVKSLFGYAFFFVFLLENKTEQEKKTDIFPPRSRYRAVSFLCYGKFPWS